MSSSAHPTLALDLATLRPITPHAYLIQITLLGSLLYLQCYLLLAHPERRLARLAALPCTVGQVLRLWLGWRFDYIGYNIFNFVTGCTAIFVIVLSMIWATQPSPPIRLSPLRSSTPSSHSFSTNGKGTQVYYDALHLLTSTRMIGWSSGTPLSSPSNWVSPSRTPHQNPEFKTPTCTDTPGWVNARVHDPNWERSEWRTHFWGAVTHYVWMDGTITGFQHLAGGTVGNVGGGSVQTAKEDFLRYLFPLAPADCNLIPLAQHHPLTSVLFTILIRLLTGFAFYQGLAFGYHVCALLGTGLLRQSAQEWPRFSDRPWKATSNFDFWGKRWHQLFRQGFIAPSRLFPPRYRPYAAPLFAFAVSAAMHDLGQLTMAGSTSSGLCVTRFFLLAGLGMSAELAFYKLTRRRVGGVLGWIWFWSYMIWTSGLVVDTWLDMGVGGAELFPEWASLSKWCFKLVTGKGVGRNDLGVSARLVSRNGH